jgi:hypothetical protein
MQVWKKDSNLPLPPKLYEKLFPLLCEGFCLQRDINALNGDWLSTYFSSVKDAAIGFASAAKSV